MLPFTALDNQLLTDQVYNKLKAAISNRVFPPGSKLDIYQIAEQFKVSRTPVKEAFNRLKHDGLITIVPRRGTFVVELTGSDIVDTAEARLVFERWAGQAGMQNCRDKDVAHLDKIVSSMERCYHTQPFNYMEFLELDIQFHEYIIQMGGNQRITEMYKGLNAHRTLALGYYRFPYDEDIINEHREIADAYRRRDVQGFLELINKHSC